MLQFFLNPWLLAGLAGVSLPVLAHLLSRRSFDVVDWAAMQFLNPSRRTRRRMKLEELLLMLVRASLVATLALAAARPWLPSGLLSGYRSAGARSVAIVIDGSGSMTRSNGLHTLHRHAQHRAVEFLESLRQGDSVALIDARDLPRTVIESPLQTLDSVAEAIRALPDPGGASNLQAAAERGIAILGRTSSTAREIVVFTDRQRASWKPESESDWNRFEDLLTFPAVQPRLWMVDVAEQLSPVRQNVSVGRILLSREVTVPDFPLQFHVPVRNSSSSDATAVLRLLLDGQPLAARQQQATIPADGETTVTFELSVRPVGTHRISVEAVVEGDQIPADNISHAAISVTSAIPVLLVNGTPSRSRQDQETFFAAIALTDPENPVPWIRSRTISASDVQPEDIRAAALVVLADVNSLPEGIADELVRHTREGNGVLISSGDNTTAETFEQLWAVTGLTPGIHLVKPQRAAANAATDVHIALSARNSNWLDRFQSDPARSFLKATFDQWWLTRMESNAHRDSNGPSDESPPADTAIAEFHESTPAAVLNAPTVLAELTTGDPLLIQTKCGRGVVLVMTSTLSRRWNNMVTQADYVPFLHECVLNAAASRIRRNLTSGDPIVAESPPIPEGRHFAAEEIEFRTPYGPVTPKIPRPAASDINTTSRPAVAASETATGSETAIEPKAVAGNKAVPFVRHPLLLLETVIPGYYDLAAADNPEGPVLDTFVVNYDPAEHILDELSPDDRARLAVHDRVRFAGSPEELVSKMYGDESRTELWAMLLWVFLALLIVEQLLTRHIILRSCVPSGT